MPSRTYYLEYHDADRLHPFGYRLAVESDAALLGRDPAADVRFHDDFPTVSRRHALIRRQEGQYIIEPLSQTNSTLVNGQRIFRPTLLRSGDEIRLSTDGPRLGIFFPESRFGGSIPPATLPPRGGNMYAGTNGYTGGGYSHPDGRRPHGFPWGIIIGIAIAVAFGLGIWKIIDLTSANRRLDELEAKRLEQQSSADSANAQSQQPFQAGSYPEAAQGLDAGQLPQGGTAGGGWNSPSAPVSVTPSGQAATESAMKIADKSVYYVMSLGFEVTTPDGDYYEIECGNGEGQITGWSGTGFLLSDGRFVTARHVVEPWYFLEGGDATDDELLSLNILASNGGKVVAYIGAVSPTGDKIMFKSSECRVNRSGDRWKQTRSGERVAVAPMGARDFATFQAGRSGGLPFSPDASRNLRRGTKLTVLSFPLGLGANSYNDINPVYGSATVAADGLQDGMILTTETTYEKGSSGGPVFITDSSGRLVVVGITSAIAGRSTGFIEPISSIR